ncbi:mitochondrial iron-sulfur cluster biosynthesis Nfu1 [Andalucia godoyi]|uniref:Mitochondrial iron-sulfur cluster biosynthesis Nfu1 n=1 Tax=Andalucia godoyi TaxID=505711 RepID=A0A8K0AHX5_ANDGO|nr:mitochondrial iron-sulfur cluster biosynthesis Nfu1 [Andalucia godoyi]|eukprot:ANDGO_03457.mRNA.1 mitochondrial iron-sulfur cluster biosynthesis Nfu1
MLKRISSSLSLSSLVSIRGLRLFARHHGSFVLAQSSVLDRCLVRCSSIGGARFVPVRTMFIQTEVTPNDDALKFKPGREVMGKRGSRNYSSPLETFNSLLAKRLFAIDGVHSVFLGPDFVTITKKPDATWATMKPDVYASIMDFFNANIPIIADDVEQPRDTAAQEGDSEVVLLIKELLETRIRPVVQEDGGDIEYRGFEAGIVKLKLVGACSTCSSSSATLKHGIENMLMHYIPEVVAVEPVVDKEEAAGNKAFDDFEKSIQNKK